MHSWLCLCALARSEEELAAAIASEDAAGLEKAIAGSTQAGGQGEIVLQGSGHNAGGEGYRGADDGQGHGFNDMGRTESSQLAAIHELFQVRQGQGTLGPGLRVKGLSVRTAAAPAARFGRHP